jgi:hypothetical protein
MDSLWNFLVFFSELTRNIHKKPLQKEISKSDFLNAQSNSSVVDVTIKSYWFEFEDSAITGNAALSHVFLREQLTPLCLSTRRVPMAHIQIRCVLWSILVTKPYTILYHHRPQCRDTVQAKLTFLEIMTYTTLILNW